MEEDTRGGDGKRNLQAGMRDLVKTACAMPNSLLF